MSKVGLGLRLVCAKYQLPQALDPTLHHNWRFFSASNSYQPDAASAAHRFCHAAPDTWHQMSVILAKTQAVLEGVAFAFAYCHDALKSSGTTIEGALTMGGGAKSNSWLGAIVTALNIPLMVPEAGDFGAAPSAALQDAFSEKHTRHEVDVL